jgi:hypothetical protein
MEIVIPPGIVKSQSGATAVGRYVDADKIRFREGRPEKIGGWVKYIDTQLDGVPRGIHAYLGPDGSELLGVGTECNLYSVLSSTGGVENITPIRDSGTLGNDPFATTDLSFSVTVTDVAHGLDVDTQVSFSGAAAVGGITIDGDYRVTEVIDNDTYTITHSVSASSTATGGGAAVAYVYRINCGTVSSVQAFGFGVGPFGEEEYGTARSAAGLTLDFRYWALDNYGSSLLACPLGSGGGSLYLYNDATDTEAEIIANAPTDCRYAFVTGERFITALREDMVIEWADQDDPTDWSASASDTAGQRTLQGGGKLVAGTRLGRFQSLIWSDKCVFSHEYTGTSFVYDTSIAGADCGLVGPGAFCTVNAAAYWISQNNLHAFAGGAVQAIPNSGDVLDWLFRNADTEQLAKAVCFYNVPGQEVWFIVPGTTSSGASDEPSYYAAVNITTWVWTVGTLARVGAATRTSGRGEPLLTSFDGYIYEHELPNNVNADGVSMPWFFECGLFRLQDAGQVLDLFGWAHDCQRQAGTHTLTITAKDRQHSTDEDTDTVELTPTTEMADLRVSGRYAKFRLEQDELNGDIRLGTPVVDTQPAGRRR